MEKNNKKDEKKLQDNLNTFLNKKEVCEDEKECKEANEIVQREHKKIITNDGRQLLSEYTI